MEKINNPKVFVPILIIALVALIFCATYFKKTSNTDAKNSIYLDEKEAAEMVQQFNSGAPAPVPQAPAAPMPQGQ